MTLGESCLTDCNPKGMYATRQDMIGDLVFRIPIVEFATAGFLV